MNGGPLAIETDPPARVPVRYADKTLAAFHDAITRERIPPEGLRVVGHAGRPSGQGPYIRIHLEDEGDTIGSATFETYGCPACIACAGAVCDMVRGASIEQARRVGEGALVARVGQLPRAKQHCLNLALDALADALGQLEEEGRGQEED